MSVQAEGSSAYNSDSRSILDPLHQDIPCIGHLLIKSISRARGKKSVLRLNERGYFLVELDVLRS